MADLTDGRFMRSSLRAMLLVWGLVAIAVGLASVVGVGRAVIIGSLAVLGMILLVAYSVHRINLSRFPPVRFTANDVAAIEALLDDARARLAPGDSAGFAIVPIGEESGDAIGQIWLVAGAGGSPEAVSIELALPDTVIEPVGHPSLQLLLADGWTIQSSQAGEWILLTRSDAPTSARLVGSVIAGVSGLFNIPAGSAWTGRAVA